MCIYVYKKLLSSLILPNNRKVNLRESLHFAIFHVLSGKIFYFIRNLMTLILFYTWVFKMQIIQPIIFLMHEN